MTIECRFLMVSGLLSIAFGAGFLLFPVQGAALVDLSLPSATAVIDVQGFYGGQLVGLGIFLLFAAARQRMAASGLLILAALLGGTAGGRLFGMVSSAQTPLMIIVLFVGETAATVAALALLIRMRSGDSSQPSSERA